MGVKSKSRLFTLMALVLTSILCFMAFATTLIANAEILEVENGKVEIYQLAPDADSLNQSYVIKTAKGKLIVIDGGAAGDQETKAPYMASALRAIAGVGAGEYFEVEAWFLSHAHSDHIAEIGKLLLGYTNSSEQITVNVKGSDDKAVTYATDTNFKINNFYFDIPNTDNRVTGSSDFSAWWVDTALVQGLNNYATVNGITINSESGNYYDDINGAYINYSTIKRGQNIYIDNVRLEILQTWSINETQVNDNSLIFRAWVDGQSLLFLNDAAVDAGNRLYKTYGAEYLKSDIVQLAHHGQNGVTEQVYQAIDAKVRLWANFADLWNADSSTQLNTTPTVRTWFGYPAIASEANAVLNKKTDLVAGLYTYPDGFDATSVTAWTDDVLSQMKISMPYAPAYEDEEHFVMNEGAGIRLNAGSTGLRFSARMASYDTEASYGFVIVPKYYLSASMLEAKNYVPDLEAKYGVDGIIKLNCQPVLGTTANKGPHYEIYGSIGNIKYSNMNLEFVGLAFKLKDNVYTYAKFDDLSTISRSVFEVAVKAANVQMQDDTAYDTDEMDIINGFVHAAVSQKNGVLESDYNASTQLNYNFNVAEETLNIAYLNTASATINGEFNAKDVVYDIEDPTIATFDSATGLFKAVGVGTTLVTAKAFGLSDTFTINATLPENTLMAFDNANYADSIYSTNSQYVGDVESVEILSEFDGEENVAKIVLKADASTYAGSDAAFIMQLPKAHSGVYTIRYRFEQYNTTTALPANGHFRAVVDGECITTTGYVNTKLVTAGIWYNQEVTMATGLLNEIGFWCNGSTTLYVSVVMDGKHASELDAIDEAREQAKLQAIKDELAKQLDTGYLASFDQANYVDLFAKSTREARVANDIKVEYLETYQNENGVIKVTSTANVHGIADIIVNLPKGCQKGITIRYMIESSTATGSYWFNPSLSGCESIASKGEVMATNVSNKLGAWQTLYLAYDGTDNHTASTVYDKMELGIMGATKNTDTVVYFSLAMDGNKVNEVNELVQAAIKENLIKDLDEETNELANYGSKDYLNLVGKTAESAIENQVRAEYLSEYEGETGVIKLTLINDSNNDSAAYIDLLKEFTSSYTVRYRLETGVNNSGVEMNRPATIRFRSTNGSGSMVEYPNKEPSLTYDKWNTLVVSVTDASVTCKNQISVYVYGGGTSGTGGVAIYISLIADGDMADEIRTKEINKTLGAGELADFDTPHYTDMVVKANTSNLGTFTTAWLSEYKGDKGVLKLTVTHDGTAGGDAAMLFTLPVAHSTAGYTIRYMFEQVDSYTLPGTNRWRYAGANNTQGSDIVAPIVQDGFWQTQHVSATKATIANQICLYTNGGVNIKYNLYISVVKEGNCVAETIAECQKANKDALAKTLGANELANFDSDGYVALVAKDATYGKFSSLKVDVLDSYEGKSGVLHLHGTTTGAGVMYISLPKAFTQSKITLQLNVTLSTSQIFGLFQTTSGGWEEGNFSIPEQGVWFTKAVARNAGDNVRIGLNGACDFDIYVNVIMEGDHTATLA